MPELPDVESFRKTIERTSLHRRIEEVDIRAPGMVLNTTPEKLREVLQGNAFEKTHRHGKFLFVGLKEKGNLMLHFGLTGNIVFAKNREDHPENYALSIRLPDHQFLVFTDTRKLGKIAWVEDVQSFIEEKGYGEDAMAIGKEDFVRRLSKRRGPIKTVLMNQKIIAGVGNEYSDEILFHARIHPASNVAKLSEKQLGEIYDQMKAILSEAVRQNADPSKLSQYFFLYHREEGLPCPGCKGKVRSETIGGRSAYYCPSCQKKYT